MQEVAIRPIHRLIIKMAALEKLPVPIGIEPDGTWRITGCRVTADTLMRRF
jgi:hypothetical protein